MQRADSSLDLYQAIVMDHSRSPRSYRVLPNATHSAKGWNRLCGDKVTIYLRLDQNERILEASFYGDSCAICKASASMLMNELPGKSMGEAKNFLDKLGQFVENWQPQAGIEPFEAFLVMRQYPTRLKCLRLPWVATKAALDSDLSSVSTEDQMRT